MKSFIVYGGKGSARGERQGDMIYAEPPNEKHHLWKVFDGTKLVGRCATDLDAMRLMDSIRDERRRKMKMNDLDSFSDPNAASILQRVSHRDWVTINIAQAVLCVICWAVGFAHGCAIGKAQAIIEKVDNDGR